MTPRKKFFRSLDAAIAGETPEVRARIRAEGDRIAAKCVCEFIDGAADDRTGVAEGSAGDWRESG